MSHNSKRSNSSPHQTKPATTERTRTEHDSADSRTTGFDASDELGAAIKQLTEEQLEIDQKNADRLTKLRAIQDRD